VRSSIDLRIQAAAVQALAGRFGGIAALEPGTGRIRALAGIAFSAPQPPGSTFKIITATAALDAKVVKTSDSFPVVSKAVIDGVDLQNANGESCGGSFSTAFADSCNSVFAPLGVKVGAKRLVAAAERFGFNEMPTPVGAAASTIPPAAQIDSPLAVGSTAIGQGKVLATPLEMAVVADVIASRGVRHPPTLLEHGGAGRPRQVTSKRIARVVEKLMIGVVDHGTGTAASLAPVQVAGKTGTAELRSTVGQPAPGETSAPPESDTDAWFAAYAPTRRPKLAVGVLFVKAGAGGATAAPAARIVLQAGLAAR
jgi:cell division protein FtsI/penicillin-binding protein 2